MLWYYFRLKRIIFQPNGVDGNIWLMLDKSMWNDVFTVIIYGGLRMKSFQLSIVLTDWIKKKVITVKYTWIRCLLYKIRLMEIYSHECKCNIFREYIWKLSRRDKYLNRMLFWIYLDRKYKQIKINTLEL